MNSTSEKKIKAKHLKEGQPIVIFGKTKLDRDIVIFKDTKGLVEYMRIADNKELQERMNNKIGIEQPSTTFYESNKAYMKAIANEFKRVAGTDVVPSHDEDAFIDAMLNYGICAPTTLN